MGRKPNESRLLDPLIDIPCIHESDRYSGYGILSFCWWCHFGHHVRAVAEEFKAMWIKYGDGYLDAGMSHMLMRLNEEIAEANELYSHDDVNLDQFYDEIQDVVNVGLMLLEMISDEKEDE